MTASGNQTNSSPFSFEPDTELLDAANSAFHDSYSRIVQQIQDKLGRPGYPVLIIEAGLAVLFFNDERYEANILPQMYHNVKSLGHLPFGTYLTLAANGPGTLTEKTVTALEEQMRLAESLSDFADQIMAHPPMMKHYAKRPAVTHRLLGVTVDLIAGLLQTGRLDEQTPDSFAKEITPLFMDHVAIAAALELDALHEQVTEWRELMGESEWAKLFVVLMLGHQARYREVSSQYFHRLLHERESVGAYFEKRIVHAESLWDEQAALKLLARHIVDSAASRAFFDDASRLQEDLMSDAAEEYLIELLPY
jgi:hypothetical protein